METPCFETSVTVLYASLKRSNIGNIYIYIYIYLYISKTFINESNIQKEEETHRCCTQF